VQQLNGIIHVCGENDTGKTTFALECGADPNRILFFDDDVKGRATIRDMIESGILKGGENYYDLPSLSRGKRETDFHDAIMKILDGVKPGQFDAIIFDTWTRFASTCTAKVKANPDKYRQFWAHDGRIKGAEWIQEGQLLEASVTDHLLELTQTVILVTHLKDFYLNNAKVEGKQIPAASRTVSRVPRMRIWLRQNPSGRPVPIGLLLKRLDRKEMIEGKGIRTVNILPRKITPHDDEHSVWDSIWRYWANPVGDRVPLPEETPDEFELSILDSTLTRDQRRTFNLMVEKGLVEKEEVDNTPVPEGLPTVTIGQPDRTAEIRQALTEGKAPPVIAQELGVALPEVLKVKAGMQ